MTSLTLRELGAMPDPEWDALVRRYPHATVFHGAAWHRSLRAARPGRVVRFAIERDGQACGHWCGFLIEKFGMRVFGSPLPGTATDYMFPLFSGPAPSPDSCLAALRAWADGARVGLVEIGGEYFGDTALTAAGYQLQPARTYRVDISGGEDVVWGRLKPAMRNKVRKAEKNGVVVQADVADDFPRRFAAMLQSVFNRQGIAPTYDQRRIETVMAELARADQAVALTASHEGTELASIILLLDATTAYYWAGASYPSAYPLAANDVIQWRALQLAIGRGLVRYDACGGGDYKEKFGGELVALPAGHLVTRPIFGLVRRSVRQGFRAKQALLGAVQRVVPPWR